jgi:SsrA-binding protein
MPRQKGERSIAQNKKARHDYEILAVFEAGVVLTGTEVKSLRAGRASLTDGFASIDDGEAWLHNVHIPEYDQGTWNNHAPRRKRKMLLHREEIRKLDIETRQSGLTIIPLRLFFKDGYAKVDIGLARGRKTHDKRQAIAERESQREIDRIRGRRSKGRED